ncbi:hypothetical protein PtrEW7m1_011928 [Pyrenophora tritici-repentis]|nr:hypothetical protein PtrEW7m1_011928 [Pyrenophora tritici-repentis]
MTVIPVYPGLKVEILVNDNALPEYEDIEDTPSPLNLVTKYIEATTGTEFKIRSMINETFPFPPGDLLLSVSFDGKPVKGLNIYSEEFYSNTGHIYNARTSQVDGMFFEQAFTFQELQLDSATINPI